MFPENFVASLKAIVGESGLRTRPEDLRPFDTDWTKLPGQADLAVLPASTKEVSAVLALCSKHGVAVVPSGGRTGLSGGAVVSQGQLALSLSRMNRIGDLDPLGRTLRVQSGAITQMVHETALEHGYVWPIDLASKGTSTVGGNLATNAGGVRVIRYGMTRKWVTALEAVLMSGEIIELNRDLEKNNAGYDLLQLLIGSEGTLAVITEATLKLAPVPKDSVVFFFAVPEIKAINDVLVSAWKGPFTIHAFEFMSAACFDLVRATLDRGKGIQASAPYYLLLEVEPTSENSEAIHNWMEGLLNQGAIIDGTLGVTSDQKSELWTIREGITESIAKRGQVVKYDVAVPVRKIADFLTAAQTLVNAKERAFELFLFGHFGDGSPHLNLVKKASVDKKQFETEIAKFEGELFTLIKTFSGSASSEHGVGIAKKSWVEFSRTSTEMTLFRQIKKAFDPFGLLNPGKLLEASAEALLSVRPASR